jgi:hypothetical protein
MNGFTKRNRTFRERRSNPLRSLTAKPGDVIGSFVFNGLAVLVFALVSPGGGKAARGPIAVYPAHCG